MRKIVPWTILATCLFGPSAAFAAGADTCAAPTGIGGLPYADTGTTIGMTNNVVSVSAVCNGLSPVVNGPDVVYSVTMGSPPNNITFSLDPTGANWDPSIYVLTTCTDGNTCAAGYGKDSGGANGTETLTLTNLPAGTYFFYVDSFYACANSPVLCAGTYSLNVTGNLGSVGPTAPVANNGTLTTAEDTPGVTTLNATDANGDTLTFMITQQPPANQGAVTLMGNQATFTPAANYNGASSFTFTASDPGGLVSNTATVAVNVTPVNDPPTANGQTLSTPEDMPLNVTLTGTDIDIGDTLTYTITSMPPANQGTVSLMGNMATFTPATNFNGSTSVSFHVTDSKGASSADATVKINVTPVNDPPIANDQSVMTAEDTPIMVTLSGSDVDTGDMISFAITSQPPMGEGMASIAGNKATFTPGLNFNGSTAFTFVAVDLANAMSMPATVNVEVTPVNDPPYAINDSAFGTEDTPLDITLKGGDFDMGDTITFEITQQPPMAQGTVTLNGATATFTPALNFNGPTQFKFHTLDSTMTASTEATIGIDFSEVNDPPVFVAPTPDDGSTLMVEAGKTLTFTVAATDPDSTPFYTVMNTPLGSTFATTPGLFSWPTKPADVGTYPISFDASDGMITITRNITLEVTMAMGSGGSGGNAGAGGMASSGGNAGMAGSGGDAGMGGSGGGGQGGIGGMAMGGAGGMGTAGEGGKAGSGGGSSGNDAGCGCVVIGSERQSNASALLLSLLGLLGIRRRANLKRTSKQAVS